MKLPGTGYVSPLRRALKKSAILHGFFLGALLTWPLLHQALYREKPFEDITFVDLTVPALPEPVTAPPEPEPESEPPAPEPPKPVEPEIVPKKPELKKPDPPKTNQVAKSTIKISTNRVKRAAIQTTPQKSSLTPDEIRRLLASGIPMGSGGSSGQPSELALYYALIRAAAYEAWVQPAELDAGLTAQVSIRVTRNGSITKRTMTRRSGNAQMDDSVMNAVNAMGRLKALPAEVPGSFKDITIDFVLTGAAY